ncbi:MAG: TetR/AcrR family transcriptional regulator [Syntrophobacterales bacterium]|jgi:AcrR family transcriptional regulator|nr:TetR/AcrR family transcriptional regulator [Syntrophobacterales bacterium]
MTGKKISKKSDIEYEAMRLFAQNGFAGTTIKEIAKLAKVTEGAIYRHYSSKEEMALSLFSRELDKIKFRLLDSMDAGENPAARLRAIIKSIYTAYLDDPWPVLFVILNFQNLQGNVELDNNQHVYEFIIDATRNLFVCGDDGRDYEFLATSVAGLIIQPVIFHSHKKLPKHPVEYIDEVTQSCCRLVGLKHDTPTASRPHSKLTT